MCFTVADENLIHTLMSMLKQVASRSRWLSSKCKLSIACRPRDNKASSPSGGSTKFTGDVRVLGGEFCGAKVATDIYLMVEISLGSVKR